MRRKSTRNPRKSSPEKTNVESQKKPRRQSSRRRKRSSSRSSEDSEEVVQTDIKEDFQEDNHTNSSSDDEKSNSGSRNNDEKSAEPSTRGKEYKSKLNRDTESPERKSSGRGRTHVFPLDKEVNEDHQEQEEGIEEKEEKKNKGKSKGKNKSKIDQSSNNIEPETENENVQGTPQSPSNDNADNENVVQNVNDSARINLEDVEQDRKEEISELDSGITKNEQQKTVEQEKCFESEYTQDIEQSTNNPESNTEEYQEENINKQSNYSKPEGSLENEKSISRQRGTSDTVDQSTSRRSSVKSSRVEEKSTTPEPRETVEGHSGSQSRKTSGNSGNKADKPIKKPKEEGSEYGDNVNIKKKITLRRSPPETKENEGRKEGERQENKSIKKITLKRSTVDERSNSNGESVGKSAENVSDRRSSEEFIDKKRRLSSFCEDKGQDLEDKPKKVHRRIKLIRNFSRESKDDEEKIKVANRQKHIWTRADWLPKLTSSLYKVDVESFKIVCPSLKFLNEDEVKLEDTPRERKRSESDFMKRKVSIDNKSEDSDRPEYEKQISEESLGDQKIELNPNIIAMNRKISIVDDTASKLRPPPSPAKHPTSDVLFITNLVRPFTVKQLKELLERTGKIKEDGFWTDRIKSKCYVHYESVEEAEATRNALHGVHWPIGNGKKLVIDYATAEDLEKAKNPAPAPAPIPIPDKLPEKENREPERVEVKYKDRDREEKKKREGPIREWDLGKEESRKGRSRSRSRSRERARKHSRRSYTPDIYISNKKQRKEEPVPQKLMDDLFLKTKATPSIYWQPLSPEEIARKQQQRLVCMEEHKRRIEQNRGRVRDNRRGSFRRR